MTATRIFKYISFHILSILHLTHTSCLITEGAPRIIDIRLQPVDDESHRRGAIEVLLENNSTWSKVCFANYSEGGEWGEKEAVVACRQLNFTGGWRYSLRQQTTSSNVSEQQHVHDVTCKGCKLSTTFGIFIGTFDCIKIKLVLVSDGLFLNKIQLVRIHVVLLHVRV